MKNKGFIFYDNWCDMLNDYYDSGDTQAAQELAFAITRLYSTGEVIPTSRKDLEMMLLYTVKPGINNQIENYERGCRGGRPRVQIDKEECLSLKRELKTWKAVAAHYQIDEDTLRKIRREWKEAEKPKNQEEEKEEENYKEKEKYKEKESFGCAADAAEITDAARQLGF